jgi:LemA protein
MDKLSIALIVILVVIALILLYGMTIYNKLVAMKNRFANSFAQIDVQLTRRYDLIPNLVETAKGYMKHEQDTLQKVIEARNIAYAAEKNAAANPSDANNIRSLAQAETNLGGALSRLMMVAESYPDLKANQNMLSIQEELSSTENKIAFARQAFNDSAMSYNIAREQFPANIFAGLFGFQPAQLLEIENPKQRESVKVQF